MWNSFMHFCKANHGCVGEEFALSKLTEEEKKLLAELNEVFAQLNVDEGANAQPAYERGEGLKAIQDRMLKVQKLMQEM